MSFELLRHFAKEQNIKLDEHQIMQFDSFMNLLIEKNKVMNLTAINDTADIEVKHFIDSLEGASTLRFLKGDNFSLLDIGCGAGFPGIPLKIAFPDSDFVLLDSLTKRINFVNEAISQIGLSKIEAVACRAEDYDGKEAFDFCTSRAVAKMNVLLEYCLPFVKVGGYCVLYKSGEYQNELDEAEHAIAVLGGQLESVITADLPNNAGDRSLVIIKKISPTPEKYPRRAGKPAKSPL